MNRSLLTPHPLTVLRGLRLRRRDGGPIFLNGTRQGSPIFFSPCTRLRMGASYEKREGGDMGCHPLRNGGLTRQANWGGVVKYRVSL